MKNMRGLVLSVVLCLVLFWPATDAHGLHYPDLIEQLASEELAKTRPNDEQRLLRHIMRAYDNSVRPVYNASHRVTVAIGMTLTHILHVDEKKQTLSTNVWLEMEWMDERIFWDPEEFGGIERLTVPMHFLWIPDIVLYNNAQDFSRGMAPMNAAVYPDGRVMRAPPVKYNSMCKLDVSYFPFDDQVCYMHFGSWIYDGQQVDVTNRSAEITIDASSFTENGAWEIVATTVRRTETPAFGALYSSGHPVVFPGLTFTLHLRRRTLFYMYNFIIPCIMLSILTMMQFWLPCESGEKITLGLTVLLAYSVFSFNIAEKMPETSEVIPLIAIYLMAIMAISAVSVTLSVIVLNLRDGGDSKSGVPVWLYYLAFNIIGPIVCWRTCDRDTASPTHQRRPSSEINFTTAFNSLGEQLLHSTQHQDGCPYLEHNASQHMRGVSTIFAGLAHVPGLGPVADDENNAAVGCAAKNECLRPILKSSHATSGGCCGDSQPAISVHKMVDPPANALSQSHTLNNCTTERKHTHRRKCSVDSNRAENTSCEDSVPGAVLKKGISFRPTDMSLMEFADDGRASSGVSRSNDSSPPGKQHSSVLVGAASSVSIDDLDEQLRRLANKQAALQRSAQNVEVIRRAGRLMDRIESEQSNEDVMNEWREVSMIVDRFFFCIICIITVGATLGLLVFAPRFSQRDLMVIENDQLSKHNFVIV